MTPNVCRKTHILNLILNAVLMLENVEVLGKLLKAREVDLINFGLYTDDKFDYM